MLGLLVAATAWRLWRLGRRSSADGAEELKSLATWWGLAILLGAGVLLGRTAITVLFAVVSQLALLEYLALNETGRRSMNLLWTVPVVVFHYLCLFLEWSLLFYVFIPVVMFAAIGTWSVLTGRTSGFRRVAPTISWGLTLTVFLPSHAVRLLFLPEGWNPVGEGVGWLLYLVLLTAGNDIAQALVGRRFGRRRLAPRLSPGKTWEGFLGGVTVTVVLAMALAAWLTPFATAHSGGTWEPTSFVRTFLPAVGAGLLISLCGLFGDLQMSALKRDVGVKDSGTLLPGQGGMLDRIDSLTFTAPAFYYYLLFWFSESPTDTW